MLGMAVGAVVCDLDTLVDISALSTARRRARWDAMRSSLGQASTYPQPEGSMAAVDLLDWAHESGLQVGVISDLPRPIARGLAERFGISCNKLIDASAGLAIGPDPAALELMTERLGVECERTLVVGCSRPLLAATANCGARSAGVSWAGTGREGWPEWQPDVRLCSPDDLAAAFEESARMGAIGEVLCAGEKPVVHWGSLIEIREGAFACGRHFSATDRRLARHRLSRLVLRAKVDPEAAAALGEILAQSARLALGAQVDLVVSVPGKPDAGFDRFEAARTGLAQGLAARDGRGVLAMVKECPDYISLDRDQRRMANQGRFEAIGALDGESVLLIDDVLTSGSQARACERALIGAGASEVRTLVAAVTQDPLQRPCPRCGEGVMRRVPGRSGPLYACTRFACRYTEPWDG